MRERDGKSKRERANASERERARQIEKREKRERESVCVCERVCEGDREKRARAYGNKEKKGWEKKEPA